MALYPSCLFNRVKEAEPYLISARGVAPNSGPYPYNIVDLSVRMRPIVDVVNKEQKKKSYIELLTFEPSKSYRGYDRYINQNKVEIITLLGAIIHERYIHVYTSQEDEQTVRLDVASDRGRWIVRFSEFLDCLQPYILSQDEIAIVVCDMIDNYRKLVRKNELEYRTKPPIIGNLDLDWLLWEYARQELELKKAIMGQIFNIHEVPHKILTELSFGANNISYKDFTLYYVPYEWRGISSEEANTLSWGEVISWGVLSGVVRNFLNQDA